MNKTSVVACHGSPHKFDRFDFSRLRDSLGVFFSEKQEHAEQYGTASKYRLTFSNLLCVRQGQEYAEHVVMRDNEKCGRDVRRRLVNAGYDGVRIEYDGGAVDYVVFSNRSITPISYGETEHSAQCVENQPI